MTADTMKISFNLDVVDRLWRRLPFPHDCKCGAVRHVTHIPETWTCDCGETYHVRSSDGQTRP
jgi:hypothetical protein